MLPTPDAGAFARLRAAAASRFRLHPEWPSLLRRAWSIRLILVAGLFSFGDVACSALVAHPPFDPLWFAALSGFFSMGALVARLVAQKNVGASE